MTWSIPNWYALLLLAVAAFRTWRLLAEDKILDPIRDRLAPADSKASAFIECAYCFGAWIAAAWWLAWVAWPHWTLVVAVPFAISAVLAIIAANADGDS
jgi:hypothetical protein